MADGTIKASLKASYDRSCGCSHEAIGSRPVATRSSYTIQELPTLQHIKAQIFPGTFTIQVNAAWWRALPSTQQAAVLAHELAHDEDPSACERCADARAGARLRWEGLSARAAVDAMRAVVQGRRTADSVLFGWQVADETIRQQGGSTTPPHAELVARGEGLPPATAPARGDILQLQAHGVEGFAGDEVSTDQDRSSVDYGDEQSIGTPDVGTPTPPRASSGTGPPPSSDWLNAGTLAIVAGLALIGFALWRKKG